MLKLLRVLAVSTLMALPLWGYASALKVTAQAAVAADATTTVIGIASGAALEGNPLISSPGALVAAVALRLVLIHEIDKLPEAERVPALARVNAISWGIVASNLAIMASASNPVGFAVGLLAGWAVWNSTEDERLFAEACAFFRQENPDIACVFRPV